MLIQSQKLLYKFEFKQYNELLCLSAVYMKLHPITLNPKTISCYYKIQMLCFVKGTNLKNENLKQATENKI